MISRQRTRTSFLTRRLCAEITLNRFQPSVPDAEIIHVPERFTVLGVAKILHKSILRASGDSLEVKVSNEINLCVPALRFESAFADVVVAGCARKGEVVGEQHIERVQILLFPHRVPLTDDLLVRYVMPSQCAGPCQS